MSNTENEILENVLYSTQFFLNIKDNVKNSFNHCFILGAGASVDSKIPSGSELAQKWFLELINEYKHRTNEFESLISNIRKLYEKRSTKIESDDANKSKKKEPDIDILNEIENFFRSITDFQDENEVDQIIQKVYGKHYFALYDLRFYPNYDNGTKEIELVMEKGNPSLGYYLLANILTKDFDSKSKNNLVITTNFDFMIEETLYMMSGYKKPLVLDHEALTPFINNNINRPIIVKLHRGLFYSPFSKSDEMNKIQENWEPVLSDAFNNYIPIVIGYSGEDETLMSVLESSKIKLNNGIYWCYRKGSTPSKKVQAMIKDKGGYFIEIGGFDSIIFQLAVTLGIYDIDKNTKLMQQNFDKRISDYKDKYKAFTENDLFKGENESIVKSKISELQLQLKNSNNKYNIYFQIGNLFFTISEYQKAIEAYLKAIKIDPNYAYSYNSLGIIYEANNELDKAIEAYSIAIKIDSNYASAYNNLGMAYKTNNELDKAIEAHVEAIKIDPNYVLAHNRLGIAYRINNELDKAIKAHLRAIKIDPNNASAYTNLGITYEANNELDKAIDAYLKAIKIDPNNVYAYTNLGITYQANNELDKAIGAHLKAIKIDPSYSYAYINLGIAYGANNELDKAKEAYLKATNKGENIL